MASLTNFGRMTHSLGRQIADALTENDRDTTKTDLRGAVEYGTHQTANDKVVVAVHDGIEIRYRVHKRSKVKGDYVSGYSIVREDGKEVGEWSIRGLPKSKSAAAAEIAWDARLQAIRIRDERSEIAKNIRAAIDRATSSN